MKKTVMLNMMLLLLLAACNTVEGVGKDVKSAGQKIESTANKVRK